MWNLSLLFPSNFTFCADLKNTIEKAEVDYSELIGALWMCCNMVVAVYLIIRTYQQLYAVISSGLFFFFISLHFFLIFFHFWSQFLLSKRGTTQFFTRFWRGAGNKKRSSHRKKGTEVEDHGWVSVAVYFSYCRLEVWILCLYHNLGLSRGREQYIAIVL